MICVIAVASAMSLSYGYTQTLFNFNLPKPQCIEMAENIAKAHCDIYGTRIEGGAVYCGDGSEKVNNSMNGSFRWYRVNFLTAPEKRK